MPICWRPGFHKLARELADGAALLECEFRDIQDVEFTVENGKLFFLQTRSAKRTPRAALHVLVDFVREGLLDPRTALSRSAEIDLERARITRFANKVPAIATALSASPGVATGRTAFDSIRAKALAAAKEPVILVRHDTSTDDVAGFAASAGILTAIGGRTAHAAVVARQLGKVCLVGCRDLKIDERGRWRRNCRKENRGGRLDFPRWRNRRGDARSAGYRRGTAASRTRSSR